MINHLELTKFLNELRMKNTELPIREYRKIIKAKISYDMFSTLLLEEGYAFSINRRVRFSTNPIHKEKVKNLIQEAREKHYEYINRYKNKEILRQQELEEINRCISYLQSKGYEIYKSTKED